MKILDRHIATQYFETLMLATFLIGGIFLGTTEYQKVMHWICNIGMDWHKACLVSFLQLPAICVFALPAGTLIATILVLYRLNCDGELLALRVAGVSHTRLMMPFFMLGAAATIISFVLGEFVSPTAMSTAARLLHIAGVYCNLPVTKTSVAIVEPVKNKDGAGVAKESRLMMIGRYTSTELKNVTVFDLVDNQVNLIHWAERGKWYRGQWQLLSGHTYGIRDTSRDTSREAGKAASGRSAAATGEGDAATVSSSSFSTMVIDTVASKVRARESDGPIPEHRNLAQLKELIEQFKHDNQPVPVDVWIDFYHRYSQPLACLLLVVAAYPIAVGNHRRGQSSGMIYGGVMTTAYFLIQEITRAMGYQGRMEPLLAVWLPSVTLMTLGLICLICKLIWQRD